MKCLLLSRDWKLAILERDCARIGFENSDGRAFFRSAVDCYSRTFGGQREHIAYYEAIPESLEIIARRAMQGLNEEKG